MAPATKPAKKVPDRATKQQRKAPRKTTTSARVLRHEFGLTRKALSRMTGLSERSLASWEAGVKLGEAGQRAITSAERLLRALAEVIHTEALASWLEQPSDGFGGLKPFEVLERGEVDRLWRMIYFLGSGTAS